MFLPILLLAASGAITPAQSDAADTVARAYLTQTCADGNEHAAVVTATDGVLRDITLNGAPEHVEYNDDKIRGVCDGTPLIFYHCHATNHRLSTFPSADLDDDTNGSDVSAMAYIEYVCGLKATENGSVLPIIEHRLVHTGGTGTIVRYGLRGEIAERVRSLAVQMGQVAAPEITYGRMGLPQLGDIGKSFRDVASINGSLKQLYARINKEYGDRLIQTIRDTCPDARTEQDLQDCSALTLSVFTAALDPCGGYFVLPPGVTKQPTCKPVTGGRITLGGPRFPGWTELTPSNYDAFTSRGRVALAMCDDTGSDRGHACSAFLPELDHALPACGQLRRGYVDVSRHADLRERHLGRVGDVGLLENGQRYTINVPHPSAQMFTLIVCGPEELFKGFGGFN